MSGPIRTAVIGVGYLGKFHAEKYAANGAASLVGVVDPDAERARQVAAELGVGHFSSIAQILGKVDAVSIVAPTVHHHAVAKECLEQGVHVLLEKPITETLEQADALIEIAARRKLVLQIGHIERFNPAVIAVKERLTAPRYLHSERCAPFTVRCTDVNVVLDLMIHDLEIACDLAAARPSRLSAVGASIITGQIDAANARILFENGCVADVSASRISDEKKRFLRVFDGEVLYTADYQAQTSSSSRRTGDAVPRFPAVPLPTIRTDTLAAEISEFLQCVRNGNSPRVTGEDGRRALALAIQITKNIEAGTQEFTPVQI